MAFLGVYGREKKWAVLSFECKRYRKICGHLKNALLLASKGVEKELRVMKGGMGITENPVDGMLASIIDVGSCRIPG